MTRTCAIHQPNFFPWMGYFNKIKECDVFVILDDVEVVKTGSSSFNRTNLKVNKNSTYITAPIKKKDSLVINDIKFSNNIWKKKLVKTIVNNYSKSKNFKKNISFIIELINFDNEYVCEFNCNSIFKIANYLGISNKNFVFSSEVKSTKKSSERLINICKYFGCDQYLSGVGGKLYQDDNLFKNNNIKLKYQSYNESAYSQMGGDFIRGLSVIDYLFNHE